MNNKIVGGSSVHCPYGEKGIVTTKIDEDGNIR